MKKLILLFLSLGFLSACSIKHAPLPSVKLNRELAQQMKHTDGYWIEIQVPQRKLVLAQKDKIVKVSPIAVGKPPYLTPVGNRKISKVIWNPWWYPPKTSDWVEDSTPVPPRSKDNPLGEIKMPLGDGYLIHGTKAVDSIGQWASHGCIRMLFEDIFGITQTLFSAYSEASAVDLMEKANANPNKEFSTALGADIPVYITYDLVKVSKGYVAISPDIYKMQKNFVGYVSESIKPYLKKGQKPAPRKIKAVLKMLKKQTIQVHLSKLIS